MKKIILMALAAPLALTACDAGSDSASVDNSVDEAATTASDDAAMAGDNDAAPATGDTTTPPATVRVDANGNPIIDGAREAQATADAVGDAADSVDRAADKIDGDRN